MTINGGYTMRAWYDIFGAELGPGGARREDDAGLRQSQALVEALIAKEKRVASRPRASSSPVSRKVAR